MGKLGNEMLRRAESGSIENAAEVARLRAEFGRLATENGELEVRVERLAETREQLGRERDAWRARYWWLLHGQLMREGHPNEVAAYHADARCAEVAKSMRDFPIVIENKEG
jgi:hypothetical protein